MAEKKAAAGKQDDPLAGMAEWPIEKCFEEMERIVGQLESPATSLEDSLKLFEQGMRLSRRCSDELSAVERKIQIIMENARGEIQAQDFEADVSATDDL